MLIQNTTLKTAIKDSISANTLEGLPSQLMDKVTPIIDCTPRSHRIVNWQAKDTHSVTGARIIFGTHAVKDTYITKVIYSIIKDATCDVPSGSVNISCVVEGKAYYLCNTAILTLTAQQDTQVVNSITPIKLDKNTDVNFANVAYTVGLFVRAVIIEGYFVDKF
jgi:hypothetical protein